VVSEVFFAVWRQAHRFKGRSTVSTWLLSIARHKALTAVKRQPMERLDDATAADIADPALGAEAMIDDTENGTTLRRCVEALSVEHGEMIDLVYYQQKSIKEIAEILAIPSNTVKTRMFYARKRLAALLEAADADCDRM
jgi:RNA polymerase sigma-70 factor (ECF subfamily)